MNDNYKEVLKGYDAGGLLTVYRVNSENYAFHVQKAARAEERLLLIEEELDQRGIDYEGKRDSTPSL